MKKTKTNNSEHARLSPSAAHRWMDCTASIKLVEDLKLVDKPSTFADEGTTAHAVIEKARKRNIKTSELIGKVFEQDTGTYTVDADMARHAQAFIDLVDMLPGEGFSEQRVTYEQWVKDGFGTVDDVHIDAKTKHLYVTDFKYGVGVKVDAENNKQLMTYALGCLECFDFMYDIEKITIAIHQPRINHYDEYTFDKDELLAFGSKLATAARIIEYEKNLVFSPGDVCQWCPAKAVCEARAKYYKDKYTQDFTALKDSDSQTPEWMAQFLESLTYVDNMLKWGHDLKKELHRRLMAGEAMEGWKLIAGRNTRKWKDEKSADRAMFRAGLKKDARFNSTLISPPQAEKKLGKTHSVLKRHVETQPGKPIVALESDKAPAWKPVDMDDEFNELD